MRRQRLDLTTVSIAADLNYDPAALQANFVAFLR